MNLLTYEINQLTYEILIIRNKKDKLARYLKLLFKIISNEFRTKQKVLLKKLQWLNRERGKKEVRENGRLNRWKIYLFK